MNDVEVTASSPPADEREITVRELLETLRRRQRCIAWSLIVFLAAATVYAMVATRRYQALSVIQIQKESSGGLGLESMMGEAADAGDALSANITIQTQANILESSTLALKVMEDLHLDRTQDFQPSFRSWFAHEGHVGVFEADPERRDAMLKIFESRLTVTPVTGTRLIEVRYLSASPQTAADVVNRLVQGLVDYNFQTRFTSTSTASKWLADQLSDLRRQSEDLEAKVVAVEKQTGVFDLGTDSRGKDEIYSVVLDRVQQSTAELSTAESNSILKGAVYDVVRHGDPEMISGLGGTTFGGAGAAFNNSLALISSLRQQQSALETQIGQMQQKFGPAYPRLIELRGEETELDEAIKKERERIGERAKNDYEVALKTEASTRESYQRHVTEANKLNDRNIDFAVLRKEAEASSTLYQDLLRRLNEAGVLEGLRASNITVVDPGLVTFKPARPRVLLIFAAAIVLGSFTGLCLALFLDLVDNKIRTAENIEQELRLPLLGILPWYSTSRRSASDVAGLHMLADPKSAYSEGIRSVTAALRLSLGGATAKVLLVTSGVAGEGKSTVSRNLAVAAAQTGKRVLLVEADMRRPVSMATAGIIGSVGLSNVLAGEAGPMDAMQMWPGTANLDILTCGPIPPSAGDLIGSQRMRDCLSQWRASYELVILDAPPVLPVADARYLAEWCDQIIVLARVGVTSRPSLRRCCQFLLTSPSHATFGVVLNAVDVSSSAHAGYYGYSHWKDASPHAQPQVTSERPSHG